MKRSMARSTAHHAALLTAAILTAAAPAAAQDLTVVELFQAQGCASCPPADANVIALSDRPDLLTLSFGVTYWDHQGWKDTFASEQYTNRQWIMRAPFAATRCTRPRSSSTAAPM